MPYGGGFRDQCERLPRGLFTSADHIILLIHGYAVNQEAAANAYDVFTANLKKEWRKLVAEIYWPGDSREREVGRLEPRRLESVLSKLSYAMQPERAREAATKLLKVILAEADERKRLGRSGQLNLHIIAHSMGCRLTLELLHQVFQSLRTEASTIAVPLIALMAPAVPTYKVIRRSGGLYEALQAPGRKRVYHSLGDAVLTWLFRPGQSLERDFPSGFLWNRKALGIFGAPDGLGVINIRRPYGHSDYWASRFVADDLNRELASLHPGIANPGLAVARSTKERRPCKRTIAA